MPHAFEHHEVYRRAGRYAGWPANYGMWAWGDEIVVVFAEGKFAASFEGHKRDPAAPVRTLQARSRDGGASWEVGPIPCRIPGNRSLSADEHQVPELRITDPSAGAHPPRPLGAPVDLASPDLALLCARTGLEAGAVSWFYLSCDRARSWEGPYAFPSLGVPGLAARTDWVPLGSSHALFLFTAAKTDGREGRVLCAETTDGALTFRLKSWVGPEPEGYAIMPSTVRTGDGALLSAIRCKAGAGSSRGGWIDLWRSDDLGSGWRFLATVVPSTGAWSSPPALLRLRDGRLLLVYGRRERPTAICARGSEDDGRHWSRERPVREGGGDEDIGYPRVVERSDGRAVTAYYWNDAPERERSIEATVFDPGGEA
jgi:hypothetical protein